MELNEIVRRAELIRDQVMKTWSPPLATGSECTADIAQTAVMQSLAFVMGREFIGEMTKNQSAAIDSGLDLFNRVIGQ